MHIANISFIQMSMALFNSVAYNGEKHTIELTLLQRCIYIEILGGKKVIEFLG